MNLDNFPLLIYQIIINHLEHEDAVALISSFTRLFYNRKKFVIPAPILKIHIIPESIVPNLDNIDLALKEAWNWLNPKPKWGSEIHFECEPYRCLGIFYSDGHKILPPTYENDMDDYGIVPEGFYACENGRPYDFWSMRHSCRCRVRPPQYLQYDEDFIYFRHERVAVFDAQTEERIYLNDDNIEQFLQICKKGIFNMICGEYEGLCITVEDFYYDVIDDFF